jgi:deoxyribonuclease V
VKIKRLHEWGMSPAEARELQAGLAVQVITEGEVGGLRYIAGVDISTPREGGKATAAVVVLGYPDLKPVEVQVETAIPPMPYIPGLLSFRESALILNACERLNKTPDLFMVDGQGVAHPRRLGLASHLGLFLDAPVIGCAKSRLLGTHAGLPERAGSFTELSDTGEVIGAVVRTKDKTRPLYVSVGHKICLPEAIRWVLECCRGYRLPEPTRLAHMAAGAILNTGGQPA